MLDQADLMSVLQAIMNGLRGQLWIKLDFAILHPNTEGKYC